MRTASSTGNERGRIASAEVAKYTGWVMVMPQRVTATMPGQPCRAGFSVFGIPGSVGQRSGRSGMRSPSVSSSGQPTRLGSGLEVWCSVRHRSRLLSTPSLSSSPSGQPRRAGSGSGLAPIGVVTQRSSSSKTPSPSASGRGHPRRAGSGVAPCGTSTHWSSSSKTPSPSRSGRGQPRRARSGVAPCGTSTHWSSGSSTPSPSRSRTRLSTSCGTRRVNESPKATYPASLGAFTALSNHTR